MTDPHAALNWAGMSDNTWPYYSNSPDSHRPWIEAQRAATERRLALHHELYPRPLPWLEGGAA